MMQNPTDLRYTKTHEWVQFLDEKTARVGLTNHAQELLSDIVFVNLCREGDALVAGDVLGDVESIKAVTDIYCPVGGTVTAVNPAVQDAPETINQQPYDAWLVTLTDITTPDTLMDADAYEAFCAEEA